MLPPDPLRRLLVSGYVSGDAKTTHVAILHTMFVLKPCHTETCKGASESQGEGHCHEVKLSCLSRQAQSQCTGCVPEAQTGWMGMENSASVVFTWRQE